MKKSRRRYLFFNCFCAGHTDSFCPGEILPVDAGNYNDYGGGYSGGSSYGGSSSGSSYGGSSSGSSYGGSSSGSSYGGSSSGSSYGRSSSGSSYDGGGGAGSSHSGGSSYGGSSGYSGNSYSSSYGSGYHSSKGSLDFGDISKGERWLLFLAPLSYWAYGRIAAICGTRIRPKARRLIVGLARLMPNRHRASLPSPLFKTIHSLF